MDGRQFDQFAKSLASGTSRRGLMKRLGGGLLGGLLVSVGITDAGAKPKTKEKEKDKVPKEKEKDKVPNGFVAPNPGPACFVGQLCGGFNTGVCGCDPGLTTTCCAADRFAEGVCCTKGSCCFLVTADGSTPVGCCPEGTECDQTVGLCRAL